MAINEAGRSILYADSGRLPFASRLSWRARLIIYHRFIAECAPQRGESILDIGVTSDRRFRESNFLERLYPYKDRITCVGTEDGSHVERVYLGVRFVRVAPGARLPFADGHFDITFSNAVIEHVGSRNRQRLFLEEMLRVSRRFFIATPNRWFVIGPHTGLPFLHYLPAAAFRRVLRHTRYRFWSEESNLNLLSRMDLLRLFPTEVRPILDWVGIGWGSCKSNLVAYGWSHDASE